MRLIDADALIPTEVHTVVVLKDGREQLESVLYAEQVDDAPTVEPASPWRRVEDGLPESGTHVLACCEVRGIYGHKSHYVCDAFHTDNKSIPCSYNDDIDSEYDEETDEYYFPVGWWEVIKNWDDYSCVAINDFVTHWMPLPEPPKEDA